jgi:hypothetical protein
MVRCAGGVAGSFTAAHFWYLLFMLCAFVCLFVCHKIGSRFLHHGGGKVHTNGTSPDNVPEPRLLLLLGEEVAKLKFV